jgi:peroxiredoxin Q/BCP
MAKKTTTESRSGTGAARRAGGAHKFSVQRTVGAPLGKAYEAFTGLPHVRKWFEKTAKGPVRTGGTYSNAGGDRGQYLLVEKPRRVRFTWDNPKHCPGTLVDVEFTSKGKNTTVRLTHSRLRSKRDRQQMKEGWSWAMDSYRSFVDSGAGIPHEEWVAARKKSSGKAAKKRGKAVPSTQAASPRKAVPSTQAASPRKAVPSTQAASPRKTAPGPSLNVAEGDRAPDFALPDQMGVVRSLADYAGGWLLVYFYPKDDTPGCTAEACAMRDTMPALKRRKAAVLGVSPDAPGKHRKFIDKFALNFPLLADTDKEMALAYGVWGRKKFMGREYMGMHRVSFLIDPVGRVARIYPKVKPAEHAAEVLKDLKLLQ